MAKEFKEKIITINLTKAFNKPKTKRAKSALHYLKQGITKETRINQIKISNGVNEEIWGRGLFNCPRKITVKLIPEKEIVRAYLLDEKIETKTTKTKETKKEEQKETPKTETKENTKEQKKETKPQPEQKKEETKK